MPLNILHVDSSILGERSVSRTLSAAVVTRLKGAHPDATVVTRDLGAAPIGHLSGAYLAGQSAEVAHDQALQADLDLGGAVLTEFLAADVLVIGVSLYNFSVSSQLKAWVDRVLVAGKTFRYSENGAEGLAGDKRAILAVARGGLYGPGMPGQGAEHAETWMRTVLDFMGITSPDVIVAEGVALGPEKRADAVSGALAQVDKLAA